MDKDKEADLIKGVEGALKATEAYKTFMDEVKTDLKTMKPKLDALDVEKIKQLADDIAKGAEAQAKANAALELKAKAQEDAAKAQEAEIKELKAALSRPGAAQNSADQKKALDEKRKNLFNSFCRSKTSSQKYFDDFIREQVTDETELKSLSVGVDPNGGYLVMPEIGGVVEEFVFESSPIRQLASVQVIGTDSYQVITDNDEAAAGWVGETDTRSATNTPVLGKIEIAVNEMQASPVATQKLLDDAIIDMESWLANKVAQKFGRFEATAFVAGNGVAKPKGFLSYASGTNVNAFRIEQVGTGDVANFTYDGLVNLQAKLKEDYQSNATFLLQRFSIANIMQIKDGQGRPIFNQMFDKNAGLETSIMGRPVRFANDMPAIAANALALAYGDFRRAYQIVDRTGLRVLRDPFTSKPNIIFYTTRRVGGGVVNFEALKLQSIG